MKQTIFTNKNFFKINIDDYASQKEVKEIVESFKECVDIFYTTFNALRKDTKNKTSEFETIFGNAESKTMSVVLNSLYEIKALLGSEIKFMRGSFFFDKKHQKHADVLASANLDKKYVSIYNPFFEKDFRKEDNRGGVIFHELAHLVGLKDESELNNIKSAECLKNFALLVSGRVSVEDVVDDSSDNVDEVKQDDEELTYSPDQPRAPKGQPNGGQWIDKNGGNNTLSTSIKDGLPDLDDKEIDATEYYKYLDFSENSDSELITAIKNPIDATYLNSLNNEAFEVCNNLFPNEGQHNNFVDAFRHAYFSYRLSEKIGTTEAKKFCDAHEISVPNDDEERIMDLMNNKIGRELYKKYKTSGKEDAIKIIMNALKNNLLRTRPYNIRKSKNQ